MLPKPPKHALRFLRWFCREDYVEEIEGDLIELFEQQFEQTPRRAKRSFWWQVIRHFRPDFIKSFQRDPLINLAMFQNYLKVAWRNLVKQKLYSAINISGLTIAMTCFILIALYVQYELSYDTQHEKADQLYRVVQQQEGNIFRGTDFFSVSSEPLAPALVETFPEVEAAATIGLENNLLTYKDVVDAPGGLLADERVFDIFSIKVIRGEGKEVLQDPTAILLSESLAERYFGVEDPMGKQVLYRNEQALTVRGIFKDIPTNQHLTYDCILSLKNADEYQASVGRWDWNNYWTYMVLAEGQDYKALEQKLDIFDQYVVPAYENFPFGASKFFLQPVKDIHLHSKVNLDPGVNGDVRYVYLFLSIAFIILLLAAINYTNLATARSISRSKEVSMRKVLGAQRKQLVAQFMGESFLLTLISFVLAVVLAYYLLPQFNKLLVQPIELDLIQNYWLLAGLLVCAIATGVLSGFYPAVFLSSLLPIKVFRGELFTRFKRGTSLRNLLVVGQFAAAVVLISSSIVVYQQLQYVQNKKLGFNEDQIVYVPFFFPEISEHTDLIRQELLRHSQIEKVSVIKTLPIDSGDQGVVEEWEGNTGETSINIYRNYVDYHFLDLFEIEMASGRNFSPNHSTDSTQTYLLNETAVAQLGWTAESAVGKTFRKGRVIGVVEDFHFQPMDLSIEPQYMMFRDDRNNSVNFGNIALKVKTDQLDETLSFVLETVKSVAPGLPVSYHFLDESLDQLYESEMRLGQAFNIFTILALLIAGIGLFGLISHSVVQRTKEIGIRKVLGATSTSIVQLLSRDFLRLVITSIVIATPLAWYLMQQWLEGFAYHIGLSWWVFLLAGLLAVAIAVLTVSIQSLKAAWMNPVKSLRQE